MKNPLATTTSPLLTTLTDMMLLAIKILGNVKKVYSNEYAMYGEDENGKSIFFWEDGSGTTFIHDNIELWVDDETGVYTVSLFNTRNKCIYFENSYGDREWYEYDKVGNIEYTITPNYCIHHYYDECNNCIKKVYSDGYTEFYEYGGNHHIIKAYDNIGNRWC